MIEASPDQEATARAATSSRDIARPAGWLTPAARQVWAPWIAGTGLLVALASIWALRTTGMLSASLDAFAA